MHAAEAGVAAVGQRADEVQRRGGMAKGLDQPLRIGRARLGRELRPVDDVAAIARQLLAVLLLDRRGARLGELAGDAADLHHRHRGGIGQHHRHLQEHAQEVADVVGADVVGARIGEAFGAVAALQQETFALGDAAERFLEVARLAGKHQRRIARELLLDGLQAPLDPGIRAPGRSACLASSHASNARPRRNTPQYEFPVSERGLITSRSAELPARRTAAPAVVNAGQTP